MKCPNCEREYGTRVRIKSGELVCNKCGYVGKPNPTEEELRVWRVKLDQK